MSEVLCPYCLEKHLYSSEPPYKCEKTAEDLPKRYVELYTKVPTLWIATVGRKNVGKSTYLTQLLATWLTLKRFRGQEGLSITTVGDYTRNVIQKYQQSIREETKAPKTKMDELHLPLLFEGNNLPNLKTCLIVLYDVAGEAFDEVPKIEAFVPALKFVQTVWFFYSLDPKDSLKDEGFSPLFSTYIDAMGEANTEIDKRKVIVIFTKGDTVRGDHENINELLYNSKDPLSKELDQDTSITGFSYNDYLFDLQATSKELKNFAKSHFFEDGDNFISHAEGRGMEIVFTATSAIGFNPEEVPGAKPKPKMVHAPFLWTLHFEGGIVDLPPPSCSLALIIDPDIKETPSEHLYTQLINYLQQFGQLKVYILGDKKAFKDSSSPHLLATRLEKPKLLGYTLEHLSKEFKAVILTNNPIIDLADFQYSWHNRIVVIDYNKVIDSPAFPVLQALEHEGFTFSQINDLLELNHD